MQQPRMFAGVDVQMSPLDEQSIFVNLEELYGMEIDKKRMTQDQVDLFTTMLGRGYFSIYCFTQNIPLVSQIDGTFWAGINKALLRVNAITTPHTAATYRGNPPTQFQNNQYEVDVLVRAGGKGNIQCIRANFGVAGLGVRANYLTQYLTPTR